MRTPLAWVGLALAIVAILYLLTPDADPAQCRAEDEVLVRVEEDGFHLDDGALACVHIDQITEVP